MCKSYETHWKKSRYESFTPIHHDIVGIYCYNPLGYMTFQRNSTESKSQGPCFFFLSFIYFILSFLHFLHCFCSWFYLIFFFLPFCFSTCSFSLLFILSLSSSILFSFFPSSLPWASVQYEQRMESKFGCWSEGLVWLGGGARGK